MTGDDPNLPNFQEKSHAFTQLILLKLHHFNSTMILKSGEFQRDVNFEA
jgi:hypothetical protein